MLLLAPAPLLASLLLALALDALIGDPAWLYRRLPHPVVLIGRGDRRARGPLARPGRARRRAAPPRPDREPARDRRGGGGRAPAAGALPLPAPRLAGAGSADEHAARPAQPPSARGRRRPRPRARPRRRSARGRPDRRPRPERLDAHGVARAAIEFARREPLGRRGRAAASGASSLGLPGMLAYKAINTLDSMVGHRTRRAIATSAGPAPASTISPTGCRPASRA